MKRQISLIISIIISIHFYGQRNTITIKKNNPDTINIVGQWIRIYDKTPSGKIIQLEKDNIDTLNYYPNNKFLKQQAGSKEYSTWELNQKERMINRRNIEFTMIYEGQIFNSSFQFSTDSIGTATRDTLTLLDLNETYPKPTLYNTRYYYRKK